MKWLMRELKVGDRIIARPGMGVDDQSGELMYIPEPYSEPVTVTKVFPHGIRGKGHGYINHKRIICKVELPKEEVKP